VVQWSKKCSGPGVVFGLMCQCVCLRTTTFEQNDRRQKYLAQWFNLTLDQSLRSVRVIGQSLPKLVIVMQNAPFSAMMHVKLKADLNWKL